MLVKMKNGGILNITSDKDYTQGCPTCDYGSCYVTYYDIKLTTINIHVEVNKMYYYLLTEGDMMEIILPNIDQIKTMTEMEFAKWLKKVIEDEIEKYNKKNVENSKLTFKVCKDIDFEEDEE